MGPVSSCPYVADPENRKQFYHREAPEKKLPCAPTDFFNETACLCTPDLKQGKAVTMRSSWPLTASVVRLPVLLNVLGCGLTY